MKKLTILLLLALLLTPNGCTPFPKKDGAIVFDSYGNTYRLRSKNIYSAHELYYLDKLEVRMQSAAPVSKDPFK